MTYPAQLGSRTKLGSARRRGASHAADSARPAAVERLEDRTLFALTVGPFVQANTSPIQLAQQLLLANTGITITGATYVGVDNQAGTYAGFDFTSGNTRLTISDGVILTTGTAQGALGPNGNRPDLNQAAEESTQLGLPGDTDADALVGAGGGTTDANALIINFTTDASVRSLLFDFVFGSEEFPDFVGTINDAFGAFVDGTQVSFDANNAPITVNNNFFTLNNSGVTARQDPDVRGTTGVTFDIEYDGLTPTIRTQAPIDPNITVHTLKFVIADAANFQNDQENDSGVFISRLQGSPQSVAAPVTALPQPGVLAFDSPIYTRLENELFATVTITRTNGTSGLVTVDLFTTDGTATAGTDYTPFPLTTITFADGQTSQTVTIPIFDDALGEGDEFFTVNLQNPTNAAGLGTQAQAQVTIIDNELGVEFLTPLFSLAEGIDTVNANITVVLTGPTTTPLIVDYATTAGGTATPNDDYMPVSGTLTFAPGQTSQTFQVPIFDDYLVEDTERINIALSNVNSPYALGLVNPAAIEVVDHVRPPAVVDAQFVTNEKFINGVALRYSEPMTESTVEDLTNYDLFLRKESKKLGGSATRTRVNIVSAVYDEASRSVTLTTDKQLRENKVYEVIANTTRAEGVESLQGDRLDGNFDDVEGDDFTGYLSRATKISYFDQEGDKVNLQLKGPGRLELYRDVERDARLLRLIDTSRDDILVGSVQPQVDGLSNAQAVIKIILTGTGFRNKLPPSFSIQRIFEGVSQPNT
jgi:hypothetical protein